MVTGVKSGAGFALESIARMFDGILTAKDWSEKPEDNSDRLKKIGNQQGARFGVICDFDKVDHKRKLQDGITDPELDDVTFWLEPDNLLFRRHLNGGDADQNWALRAIVDENNVHNERENRSTPVVDQRKKQNQGHLHDVFKVRDVGATSKQLETIYSAAGEWIGICGTDVPSGEAPRYHLVWNLYELAGYMTDAETIAQARQLFKFIKFSKDVATGGLKEFDQPCTATSPFVQDESVDGEIVNRDGQPYGELGLWSDIIFFRDDANFGPFGIDTQADACPRGMLVHGGNLFRLRRPDRESDFDFPDPENLDNGKLESALEDSPRFGRKTRTKYIRPWIRIPFPDIPTNGHGVPRPVPVPAGEDSPRVPTGGSAGNVPAGDYKAGKTTALQNEVVIPLGMEGRNLLWRVYFSVTGIPVAGQFIRVILGVNLIKCDAAESLSTAPTYTTINIPVADFPAIGDLGCVDFTVPSATIEEGDLLVVSLWRSKLDTFLRNFQLVAQQGFLGAI